MWMLGIIIWRLLKSGARVLLVGWTPKPPPDFEARLITVEHKAEATRQKVYRDTKDGATPDYIEPTAQVQPSPIPETDIQSFPSTGMPAVK